MTQLSVVGSIHNFGGIASFLYVIVLTLKCVMTCEFGKGPSWGLRLWYRCWFGNFNIVIEFGLLSLDSVLCVGDVVLCVTFVVVMWHRNMVCGGRMYLGQRQNE